MVFKIGFYVIFALVIAQAACAAEILIDGHLYTSLRGDGREGVGAAKSTPKNEVSGDGTPEYTWRYEADIGVTAGLSEDTTARLAVTLDDRKQARLYRYSLATVGPGGYVLVEEETTGRVYASLEDISVTKLGFFGLGDLTAGGFDIRYGDGGYYNDFINDIDSNSFIAYLDPYGGRLSSGFGPFTSEVAGGVGADGEEIFATKGSILGFGIYFALEGKSYDLRSLWDVRYAGSLPGYWRAYYRQNGYLRPDVQAEPGKFGDTLHFGVDRAGAFSIVDYYFVFSYHKYKDSVALDAASRSGGSFIQIYPDIGISIIKPYLWVRGAFIYERWSANDSNAWGERNNANSDLLLWGEPQFFIREDMFVGCGFMFQHPSVGAPADIQGTPVDVETPMSIAVTPHIMYSPAEFTKIDVTFDYKLWDYSYDLPDTGINENVERAITLDVEVMF